MPIAPTKQGRRRQRKSGSSLVPPTRAARRTSNRRRVPLRQRLPSIRQVGAGVLAVGRRSLPTVGIIGAVALAIGGGYYGYEWITHSPRFAITELELIGEERMDEAEIRELLALPPNANIFRTDMGSLEARLVASPWIISAEISRSLPTGLEITLEEQHPAAAVDLGGLYLVNQDGALFKRANISTGELDGLCIITGIERDAHLRDPEHSQERLQRGLAALRQFNTNDERPRIGELHLDERHGISLITFDDAIAIHIGTPSQGELAGRYRAFDSAWKALDAEEHAAARSFRIADRTPSDRVTVAFAGN